MRILRPRWPGTAVLLLLLAALLPSALAAQEQQSITVEVPSFSATAFPQTQAVVTVLGGDDRPLAGLSASQFQAQLNGTQAPVTSVVQAQDGSVGIGVVLALDVSSSMEGAPLEQAKAAARSFLDGLGPNDSVAVIAFADTAEQVLGFTRDRAAAGAAIDGLTTQDGTALYQGTLESLRLASSSGNDRRALVLLSDGLDNIGGASPDEAIAISQTQGVPAFAIALGSEIDRDFLQELAAGSGGTFAETPSSEGLLQLYATIGELLRGQYILTIDAAGLDLPENAAATLHIDVTVGEITAGAERIVAPRGPAVLLTGIDPGDELSEEHTITAQVIAADAVTSVAFLVDGQLAVQLTDPPYQFDFDPAGFAKGDHTLRVEVITAADETSAKELVLSTAGAAPVGAGSSNSGGSSNVLLFGAGAVGVALVAGLALFMLLRRRGHGPGPDAFSAPEPMRPPPAQAEEHAPGMLRKLWHSDAAVAVPAGSKGRALGQLIVSGGPLHGQTFQVSDVPTSIGSGHRCRIRFAGEGEIEVASEEARVWVRSGQLMVHELRHLTDTGSVGGVWAILGPGEAFDVGPSSFQFHLLEGDVVPAELPPAQEQADAEEDHVPAPTLEEAPQPLAPTLQEAPQPLAPTLEEAPQPVALRHWGGRAVPRPAAEGAPGETAAPAVEVAGANAATGVAADAAEGTPAPAADAASKEVVAEVASAAEQTPAPAAEAAGQEGAAQAAPDAAQETPAPAVAGQESAAEGAPDAAQEAAGGNEPDIPALPPLELPVRERSSGASDAAL